MSHELRTPLNSLLILSRLLAQNSEGTLTEKQVEFAKTIHASGSDLLELINEILDLSKIESGMMDVDAVPVSLGRRPVLRRPHVPRGGRQQGPDLQGQPRSARPSASIITDQKRVQQVLKNLISNAIKFTESGSVTLTIEPATQRLDAPTTPALDRATSVVAFQRRRHRHRHSRPTSTRSSSRRSSRPTARPAASTAAPASACRSAARSRSCSAARSA